MTTDPKALDAPAVDTAAGTLAALVERLSALLTIYRDQIADGDLKRCCARRAAP